jgi:hypothetical protein
MNIPMAVITVFSFQLFTFVIASAILCDRRENVMISSRWCVVDFTLLVFRSSSRAETEMAF